MFDPLHVALISLLTAFFGGLFVFLYNRTKFVSCTSCKERHDALDKRLNDGERKFKRLGDQVAALVVYNPNIPEETKADLLATSGGQD